MFYLALHMTIIIVMVSHHGYGNVVQLRLYLAAVLFYHIAFI